MTPDQDKLFRSFLDSKDKQFTAICTDIDNKIIDAHKRVYALEGKLETTENTFFNYRLDTDLKLKKMNDRIKLLESFKGAI